MEESIKRAEKLVHATNSALAQMKYNLTFDKLDREPHRRSHAVQDRSKRTFSYPKEFENFEQEFMSEANEMLMKMDKILEPSQYTGTRLASSQASKAREKMREINRKLEGSRRSEPKSSAEVELSRLKLMSLLGERDAREPVTGSGRCLGSDIDTRSSRETFNLKESPCRGRPPVSVTRLDLQTARSPDKSLRRESREELRLKLLETQEIVDRGFQTARQLTQRVDNITRTERRPEKTPTSEKTFASEDPYLKSVDRCRKSESNETLKSSASEKCHKCHRYREKARRREKARKSQVENLEPEKGLGWAKTEETNHIIRMKWPETRRPPAIRRLNLHHLPSVHIKGGLQMQKIYTIEIPAEKVEADPVKVNTGVTILSHEDLEKERSKKVLEDIQRENCFCRGGDDEARPEPGSHVECFNCGKLIRVKEPQVDPREIDRLLLKCRFNVFDPRIDEFVEKWKPGPGPGPGLQDKGVERVNAETSPMEKPSDAVVPAPVPESKPEEKRLERMRGTYKIEELSRHVVRKYTETTNELEEDHREFESILRSLFKRIDDSRQLFADCRLFKKDDEEREESRKATNLMVTKPLLVCLKEDPPPNPDVPVDSSSSTPDTNKHFSRDRHAGRRREKKLKLNKKDVKNKWKSRKEQDKDQPLPPQPPVSPPPKEDKSPLLEFLQVLDPDEVKVRTGGARDESQVHLSPKLPSVALEIFNEMYEGDKVDDEPSVFVPGIGKLSESSLSVSTGSVADDKNPLAVLSETEMRTDNDYESDFEGESSMVPNDEGRDPGGDSEEVVDEEDAVLVKSCNKLSTITEVDSDLEKRITEEYDEDDEEKSDPVTEMRAIDAVGSQVVDREPRTNVGEVTQDIEDVVNRAFEKGIAYTLKHQATILESMRGPAGHVEPTMAVLSPLGDDRKIAGDDRRPCSPKSKSTKSRSEGSMSQRTSSTEVVASLKEVLSALKDQFQRTQLLADKLTENVKGLQAENEGSKDDELPVSSGDRNLRRPTESETFAHIQRIRREDENDQPSPDSKSLLSLLQRTSHWTPGGATTPDTRDPLTEMHLYKKDQADGRTSDRKRKEPEKSESSSNSEGSFARAGYRKKSSRVSSEGSVQAEMSKHSPLPLGSRNNDASYSEGEIPSHIVLDEDSSMQSIGEVVSESVSEVSHVE